MKYAVFFVYLLCFLILSSSVFAVALAMPPQKVHKSFIGENLTFIIQVINQENSEGEYKVLFNGELKDRAKAEPSSMTISPKSSFSKGIENSKITIDSEGLFPGKYSLTVIVELGGSKEGAFSIVQQVTRTVYVEYEYPPSFISKVLNFIFTQVKNAVGWIKNSIRSFYHNNPWINYLLLMICLGLFFYAGMNADKIIIFVRDTIRACIVFKHKILRERKK